MKKLLITGFEAFGGESINPSWEAVSALPLQIGDYSITKLKLPVLFKKAAEKVIRMAEELCPDVILCIGQAGGRDAITPELVGINLKHASIPDNDGCQPKDEAIIEKGCTAYFSNLPVRRMSEEISSVGIASRVSYSAGSYVCNELLYTLLARYSERGVGVGFIHIPYCREQGKEPCMETDQIVQGLITAIKSIDK